MHRHILLACLLANSLWAATPDFSKITSAADLDALAASAPDAAQALKAHRAEILLAIEERAHAEAVTRIVEGAKGKVEKINTTPEDLKKLAGGEMPVFDTLKLVDLAVPNAGPHDARTSDPYDVEFFAHVGRITALEFLNIIATKFSDDWMASIAQLTNLKTLRFTNNGKLSDVGLEQLVGLKNVETFSFVGTGIKGHAFAKFEDWTHLRKCSFRGSSIDDEGLAQLCAHFPNLESISLAHAKFTDAGAAHLAKLTKLKGLEVGTHDATPASLGNLKALPLEYLQLGEGFESPESLAIIKDFKALNRLTLTNCLKTTDSDLQVLAAMKQLQSLELGDLPMTEERTALLKPFAFLTSLRLVQRPKAYLVDIQAKITELLPKVQLTFD